MACRWFKAPDGQWLVSIPVHELLLGNGGLGTYSVERRDGTSQDVMVVRLSAEERRNPYTDEKVRLGVPEDAARDRAARVAPLSHSAPAPTQVRLTKQRDHVVAPVAVLERACRRHGGKLAADDLEVWVDREDDWAIWSADGVRMAKAPIAAAKALV